MVHNPTPPFKAFNTRVSDARKALAENEILFQKAPAPIAQNLNTALRFLVESMAKIETDMILLHAKLQPLLKSLEEDNDWRSTLLRSRIPRDEHE